MGLSCRSGGPSSQSWFVCHLCLVGLMLNRRASTHRPPFHNQASPFRGPGKVSKAGFVNSFFQAELPQTVESECWFGGMQKGLNVPPSSPLCRRERKRLLRDGTLPSTQIGHAQGHQELRPTLARHRVMVNPFTV